MGWFKGFGRQPKSQRIAPKQPASEQTFILEPILTPSGLVDDPTYTPGALDLAPPDPVPTHWQGMMPELDHSLLLPESVDVPAHELEPLAFFHASLPDLNPGSPFTSGVFTVGSTGQVTIDYLFDGGGYQGELAIFSLEGMELYEPGSEAFIQEAARRALSETDLGHVVVRDAIEGAKYSGGMSHEGDFNSGEYREARTVSMKAGSQFGVMLVPNGTVEQVLTDPGSDGSIRPLFSLATANPNDTLHVGQIGDVTGQGTTFAMEDLRTDGYSDRDYNDIVFRVQGATGQAESLDFLLDAGLDWRTTELGQQIAAYDPFNIELEFGTGLTDSQRAIIEAAAKSVEALLTQGVPTMTVEGHQVDDIRFKLSIVDLDGDDGILARTRLDVLREGTLLPAQSITQFDAADIAKLEQTGRLFSVVQHELLHGLGFGTLWEAKNLIDVNTGGYIGTQAIEAFQELGGLTKQIPIEPTRSGTSGVHWSERVFQDEVMTHNLGYRVESDGQVVSPLSKVTLAALADLGYSVDMNQADRDYKLFGGQLALQKDLTPAQWAGMEQLAQSAELLQAPIKSSGLGIDSSSDGWAHGEGDELLDYAGKPNLLWRNVATGDTGIWLMDGNNYVTSVGLPYLTPNWELGATGDFNRDGHQDLLWQERNSGQLGLWAMNGTSIASSFPLGFEPDLNWRIAGTADFDGDGNLDILWRNYSTGENRIWQMFAGATLPMYATTYLQPVSTNWAIQGVGDFNGDGKPDLLWRDYSEGYNGFWFMNGTTFAGAVATTPVSTNWAIQGVDDFNGDGRLDIFWREYTTGVNGVWLMNGTLLSLGVALPPVTNLDYRWYGAFPMSIPAPKDLALSATVSGSTGNLITNSATPTITGKATPGTTIKLHHFSEGIVGQGKASLDGTWQITINPLWNANHTLTATATSALGLISIQSQPLTFTIDSQPPAIPGDIQISTSTGSNQVQTATPTLTGTGEPGSTVQLFSDGQLVGQATVRTDGTWQITTVPLTDGAHSLTLTATDTAGNVSATSNPVTIVVDTQAPASPTDIKLVNNGQISTNYSGSQPTVTGQAEPGSTVQLYSDGQLIGVGTTNAQGIWQVTSTVVLTSGTHSLTATVTDLAGNTSPASNPVIIQVDITPPTLSLTTSTLTIAPIDQSARLTGSAGDAEAGVATVQYQWGEQTPISVTLNATGEFDQPLDFTGISDGSQFLTVIVTDNVGVQTRQTIEVTVALDRTAPVLTVELANDTAASGSLTPDRVTQDPTLRGTVSDNNNMTQLLIGFEGTSTSQLVNISTLLQSDGRFTINRTQLEAIYGESLPEGQPLTVQLRGQDQWGNTSEPVLFTFTLDQTPPTLTLNSIANHDSLSDAARLVGTVEGANPALSTLTYRFDNLPEVTVALNPDGSFDQTLRFTGVRNGDHTLTVTATDEAGNVTATTRMVTVNTSPRVVMQLANDTGLSGSASADGITNDPSMTATVDRDRVTTILAGFNNVSAARYRNITNLIGADGQLNLDLAALEDIYRGDLPDGVHALKLQIKDESGETVENLSVQFQLDRQAPELRIDSLINGIVWENETLGGWVEHLDDGTQILYAFNGSPDGGQGFTPSVDGSFTYPLSLPTTPGEHTLRVTVVDPAGNRAPVMEYQFLVRQNTPLVDDDLLTGPDEVLDDPPGDDESPNPGSPDWGDNAPGGPGGLWGFIGPGGTWGNWSGTGGWNPSGFPGLSPGNPDPDSPSGAQCRAIDYQDRIEVILRYGAGIISNSPQTVHKKAALRNRKRVLQQVGQLVEAGGFYNQMYPVMHGIFYDASTLSTDCQSITEGYQLAQDVVTDDDAVRLKVFQTSLLAVVNQVFEQNGYTVPPYQYQTIVEAVLEIGKIYAQLNPQGTISADSTTPDFLDALWRAQKPVNNVPKSAAEVAAEFNQSIAGLNELLQGAFEQGNEAPIEALSSIRNVLQASAEVSSLNREPQQGVYSIQFVQELVALGAKYAESNVDGASTSLGEQRLPMVFNQLSVESTPQAVGDLSRFFAHIDTPDQRQTLTQFSKNLLKALGQLQASSLESFAHKAEFVDLLLGLGSAYIALNPQAGTGGTNSFLETLLVAEDDDAIGQAVQQLEEFFQGYDTIGTQTFLLLKEQRLLRAAKVVQKNTPNAALKQQWSDPAFIHEMMDLVKAHAAYVDVAGSANEPTPFFLDTLYRMQSDDVSLTRKVAQQMEAFFQGFDSAQELQQLAELTHRLTQATTDLPNYHWDQLGTPGLNQLLLTGREYAALEPNESSSPQPLNFFLDTLWQTADVEKGTQELDQFLQGFEVHSLKQPLQFEANLLRALNQVQDAGLKEQRHDAAFVKELMELGSAYASLEPQALGEEDEPLNFFLNTLYEGDEAWNIRTGSKQLEEFFEEATTPEQRLLIEYERKLLSTLKLIPEFQEPLKDPFFVSSILSLGKEYLVFKAEDVEIDASDDFLTQVWRANSQSELRVIASNFQMPSEGRFDDTKLNLFDYIANGPKSIDDIDNKDKILTSYNYDRIRRPHDVTVITRNITLLLRDWALNDYDTIAISVGGEEIFQATISNTFLRVPIRLKPGTNTINIRSVSTGVLNPATLDLRIPRIELDRNAPNYRGRDYIWQTRLAPGASFDITVGLPQVPVDARRNPDIAKHTVDAWSYGYPRILTIDRFGRLGGFSSKDQRSNASITRYLRNPDNPDYNAQLEELDEYPPAMFLENRGTAHVRAINAAQNASAGTRMGNLLSQYRDGEQVEVITNYPLGPF